MQDTAFCFIYLSQKIGNTDMRSWIPAHCMVCLNYSHAECIIFDQQVCCSTNYKPKVEVNHHVSVFLQTPVKITRNQSVVV